LVFRAFYHPYFDRRAYENDDLSISESGLKVISFSVIYPVVLSGAVIPKSLGEKVPDLVVFPSALSSIGVELFTIPCAETTYRRGFSEVAFPIALINP
jgi:hypothetical protein